MTPATARLDAQPIEHATSRMEMLAVLSLAEYHARILDGLIEADCSPKSQAERLGLLYGKLNELRALVDKISWTCVEVRAKETRE